MSHIEKRGRDIRLWKLITRIEAHACAVVRTPDARLFAIRKRRGGKMRPQRGSIVRDPSARPYSWTANFISRRKIADARVKLVGRDIIVKHIDDQLLQLVVKRIVAKVNGSWICCRRHRNGNAERELPSNAIHRGRHDTEPRTVVKNSSADRESPNWRLEIGLRPGPAQFIFRYPEPGLQPCVPGLHKPARQPNSNEVS